MLSTETKRHIDNARDILVGVVPVPTSQIEQITNALIYKFMDDMDHSAIKAGGDPTFFVGDLENYSWSRLMSERVGSQERMNLYRDALSKFSTAKQLPELFRDIFRAAFLPYNSPEVLDLFLKEISYFDYKHSEELGNAYEYLLSIMGSQGDAGMFRTPRHIIDFVVDIVNPTKDDKVLDPACGTAGFLISAYKHILEQHDGKDDPEKKEIPITPEQRKRLFNNFEGYDVSPEMVKLSKVNMYLHQFRNPQIFAYNTLTSEERWNDKYDVILANPPFMTARGGVKTHNRFSVNSKQAEVLFVDYIMNHLRPKGRAGIIVPEGIIFKSDTATKQLRKNLVEDGLYAVVSLPSGVFNPYAGVKTSILLFDNARAKEVDELLFVKIENDGYDLGAQRRPINKNDLPEALKVIEAWRNGEKQETTIAQWVPRAKVAETGDYNLSVARYIKGILNTPSEWPLVALGDVFEIESGGTPDSKKEAYWGGEINWATLVDIPKTVAHVLSTERKITPDGLKNSSAKILPAGTVLVSSRATIGRIAIASAPMATNQGFKNILPKPEVALPEFVAYALTNCVGQMESMASGGTFKEISKTNFATVKIPLPPLEVQQQIVTELDGYQKIIDSARQIVGNWKPSIAVDPEWPSAPLSELASYFNDGNWIESKDQSDSGIRLVQTGNIGVGIYRDKDSSKARFINEQTFNELNCTEIYPGDILISRLPDPVGRACVIPDIGQRMITSVDCSIFRPRTETLLPAFFVGYTLTDSYQQQIEAQCTGASRKRISRSNLGNIMIPVPSLEVQQQIVNTIEGERTHIESARALIDLYTQKTQATIAKLWHCTDR